MVKYARIPYSANDSPRIGNWRSNARKSIVLLKNDGQRCAGQIAEDIAVIGPNADDEDVLVGNYNGTPSAPSRRSTASAAKSAPRQSALRARQRLGRQHAELRDHSVIGAVYRRRRWTRQWLKAEYYAPAVSMANATAAARRHGPTRSKRGQASGYSPAVVHAHRCAVDFNGGTKRRGRFECRRFGVRWTGFLRAPASGPYQLGGYGRNAFEIYLDENSSPAQLLAEAAYSYAAVELGSGQALFDSHRLSQVPGRCADAPAVVASAGAEHEPRSGRSAGRRVVLCSAVAAPGGEEMRVPVEGFKGGDRIDIGLPAAQQKLMEEIVALGKPWCWCC